MSGQSLFCATQPKRARFFRKRIRRRPSCRVRCCFHPLAQYLVLQKYLDLRFPTFRGDGGGSNRFASVTADALSSVQRPRLLVAMIRLRQVYEVRPRKDKCGVNLISDVLPLGVSNGGGVGFLYSCSPGGG